MYKEQLDTAVDWCERRILAELNINAGDQKLTLEEVLGSITYEESDVKLLSDFFVIENRKAGEYLFNEGDKGERFYFVGSGTVVVVLKVPHQK